MRHFDSHLDYSQQSPLKGESFFFSFFMWYISLQVYEWPFFGCGYAVSHFSDPFGYVVSHSKPSALIPLLGLYIFHMGYGYWEIMVLVIYDISLTHIYKTIWHHFYPKTVRLWCYGYLLLYSV